MTDTGIKTIVNRNIKLKTAGGILNSTTDGVYVDTGTTASKIVKLDGSAKLPAVDGSALTNLYTSSANLLSIPSTNLRTSDDALANSSVTSYTKAKEILFNDVSGSITVKFSGSRPSPGSRFGKIYVNGNAVGTERAFDSSSTEYTENISVNKTDLVQIYINHGGGTGGSNVTNFRLYYDKTPKFITNTVNI